jgi:hypothetical protein
MSTKRTLASLVGLTAATVVIPLIAAAPASADIPAAWTTKTSICASVSFYSQNPAYNPGVDPTHELGGHKRFYYTSGPIVNGWMPVYSAGQDEWHTGWARQECMADGWGYPADGYVIY